jgi:hypothetical protein
MSVQHPVIHGEGGVPGPAGVKVVAFYEPSTGDIVHVHTIVTFVGGRVVGDAEAIERARAQATAAGHPVERLKARVSTDIQHAARPHQIDPSSGEFVPLQPPQFRRPSGR